MTPKYAPVQMPSTPGGTQLRIPWRFHQKAWEVYGKRYNQSAERLAERGGFGLLELLYLLAGEDPYSEMGKDGQLTQDKWTPFPPDGGSHERQHSG